MVMCFSHGHHWGWAMAAMGNIASWGKKCPHWRRASRWLWSLWFRKMCLDMLGIRKIQAFSSSCFLLKIAILWGWITHFQDFPGTKSQCWWSTTSASQTTSCAIGEDWPRSQGWQGQEGHEAARARIGLLPSEFVYRIALLGSILEERGTCLNIVAFRQKFMSCRVEFIQFFEDLQRKVHRNNQTPEKWGVSKVLRMPPLRTCIKESWQVLHSSGAQDARNTALYNMIIYDMSVLFPRWKWSKLARGLLPSMPS